MQHPNNMVARNISTNVINTIDNEISNSNQSFISTFTRRIIKKIDTTKLYEKHEDVNLNTIRSLTIDAPGEFKICSYAVTQIGQKYEHLSPYKEFIKLIGELYQLQFDAFSDNRLCKDIKLPNLKDKIFNQQIIDAFDGQSEESEHLFVKELNLKEFFDDLCKTRFCIEMIYSNLSITIISCENFIEAVRKFNIVFDKQNYALYECLLNSYNEILKLDKIFTDANNTLQEIYQNLNTKFKERKKVKDMSNKRCGFNGIDCECRHMFYIGSLITEKIVEKVIVHISPNIHK